MMTSARPMAISRSRVHTRISLRRLFVGEAASEAGVAEALAEAGTEEITGPGFSGGVDALRCFWSERSILGALLFIAWASRRAPVAILPFAQQAPGAAEPYFSHDSCGLSPRCVRPLEGCPFSVGPDLPPVKSALFPRILGACAALYAQPSPCSPCSRLCFFSEKRGPVASVCVEICSGRVIYSGSWPENA